MFTGVTLCLIGVGTIIVGNNKNKIFGIGLLVIGGSLISNNGRIEVL